MHFSDETLKLLDQANAIYPGSIVLHGSGEASGMINHDQITSDVLGSRMALQVTDATAPDFTATHELLHMLLALNGFPQVFFQLKAPNDDDLTEQMMVMASYLYRPALHAIIYQEQFKHGMIDQDVVDAYVAGINHELTPESNEDDNAQAALRIMLLLDAQVFFNAIDVKLGDAAVSELQKLYPVAWKSAKVIFEAMKVDTIKDSLSLHRAVIAAFDNFDVQMAELNLPLLHAKEFATLTPVLSERQLRLSVNQVFTIKHVDWLDETTMQPAYVGLSKQDEQNSFVLPAPEDESERARFFKELYQLSVSELFDQIKQPYTLRD
ncbi:IpaB/EvcA family protein [Weissella minor]|uniref:IpaB/EvcA family protein n=1 Tax=Weissella minor TaxID=1620 RepID=UPI003AF30971